MVATGGQEKKLRIWDFNRCISSNDQNGSATGDSSPNADSKGQQPSPTVKDTQPDVAFEVGLGQHTKTIKSIVWHADYNIITTASEDKKIRWFDLRDPGRPVHEYQSQADIGSCELNTLDVLGATDGGMLGVAAGKQAIVFEGSRLGPPLKIFNFDEEIASVAVNAVSGKIVTGGKNDPWARVYDFTSGSEIYTQKGHHGPIWTTTFSPDGRIFATGSEDGTIKLHNANEEPFGLWKGAASG